MSDDRKTRGQATTLVVLVPLILILVPIGFGAASALIAPDAGQPDPFLEAPTTDSELCIMDKDAVYMRYHHMDLLKRIRDRVLRDGDRKGGSFDDCKGCHTSRERFCNRCHELVNLTPDCFGCHDYP